MAKSRRQKAKKSVRLENRVKEASFTLAAVLFGQLVEFPVKRSLDRTGTGDENAPALRENLEPATRSLREGIATVKSIADDLNPRWSAILASYQDKIQRAVERVTDAPGAFNRVALLGRIDGSGETLGAPSPESEAKTSKKKQKSQIISGDLDAGTKSDQE